MACGTTKVQDDRVMKDRLSSLPRKLINSILQYLPVDDAARTCVLSKAWLHIWEMHPQIVLDQQFFDQAVVKKRKEDIVFTILLRHTGPIQKFHLYIPPCLHDSPSIDAWIRYVANNGVRNLKLINSEQNALYQLPSSLFSCSLLTKLSLTNLVLNLTHKFEGYRNLTAIELVNVSITSDMSFGDQPGSNTFSLASNPVSSMKQSISLDKLLVNMPDISLVSLYSTTLKCLEPGPKKLATTMEKLNTMQLYNLEVYDLRQISNVICLIRSSPNMENLLIQLEAKARSRSPMDLRIESYLESVDCISLDRLQTVKINGVGGSRAELNLIKFLLASSPSLKTMTLLCDHYIYDLKIVLKIGQKLMRFRRKSPVAEVIWA